MKMVRGMLIVVGIGALVALISASTSRSASLALAVGVITIAVAVTLRFRGLVLIVVLAAAYGTKRLGPASANLSLADGALLLGAFAALPFVPWNSRRLRQVVLAAVAYESVLAITVVAHPAARVIAEWGHRILLVVGALLVGGALARTRRIGTAFRLYLATSAIVALASLMYAVTHRLAPAYPFGIQKNDVGLLLSLAFLISVLAPRTANVPAWLVTPMRAIILVGLLCTQSRSAMLAAIVVLGVVQLRSQNSRRAIAMVIVAGLAMGGVIYAVTQQQDARARAHPSQAQYFGIGARESTYREALTIWSHDTVFGAGLRYFRDPSFNTTEPHDVAIETLAESGVVGLVALSILLLGAWRGLRGLRGELPMLARCALATHLLAGLFDIYWVAGRASFAWIIIGMALGAHAVQKSQSRQPVPVLAPLG